MIGGCIHSLASNSCARSTPRVDSSRWRGFNLQEKFTDTPQEWQTIAPEWGRANEPFKELDFQLIAELGFNFVRLPMSYR